MYQFAVADRLGMTVGELGERMTIGEFWEWLAYIGLENGTVFGGRIKTAAEMRR